MEKIKSKNIAILIGVYEGHFTASVEIVKELVELGHNVTCFVLEKFSERLKKTGAKLKIFSIDKSDLYKSSNSVLYLTITRSIDAILTEAVKNPQKYDYLVVDSLLDGNEMNKIFKAKVVISIYTAMIAYLPPEMIKQYNQEISQLMIPVNKKFNLNMRDYVIMHSVGDAKYKLMLTSKEFHLSGDSLDKSFYFIGPSTIEERPIDESFSFKKDLKKKLIYISLGTLFNNNLDFYKICIEAFGNSEEFQVIMSVGKVIDLKKFENVPKNFHIFNFLPQHQVLKITDIFISHGGLNSLNERLILNEKPIIIIPQEGDQYMNAIAINGFEAGISIFKDNLTSKNLKDAVNSIIINEKKYCKGVQKILQSFKEARKERKNIFKKLFV